jgi:hypothetical protein
MRLRAAGRWRKQRSVHRGLAIAVRRLLLLAVARSAAVEASKKLLQVRHGEGELGDLSVC